MYKDIVTYDELQSRIANNQAQAKQAELLAMLRHGELVSGAYRLRKLQQGREPNEEEKAEGRVVGFRDYTDEEKLQETVATMHRHIEWARKFSEAAASMMKSKKIDIDGQEMYEIEIPEFY